MNTRRSGTSPSGQELTLNSIYNQIAVELLETFELQKLYTATNSISKHQAPNAKEKRLKEHAGSNHDLCKTLARHT